jgi:hypothetical protein
MCLFAAKPLIVTGSTPIAIEVAHIRAAVTTIKS